MSNRNIKSINAVIYARYSSHAQNEQSIEGQISACIDFAARNGYTIIEQYIDRAISGTSDNRPEFQRMIADSAKRHFEAVICYQLDRFARNRYDSATNKNKLKKNGVRVLSARENISDDASGVLMEAVLEGMAEYYSVELSQKIRRGMDINAQKCLSTGGNIALGYKVDENKHFQIDEQAAAVVVKIFEMYASGKTVAQICEYLNRQHIRTSRGAEFNKNSLRTMLQNKRYIGIYTYKGGEMPGGIPRIVSDDLFYRVNDVMNKNKKAPARARAKAEYLLTTKLFCGHCRSMMTGISGTGKADIYYYYVCNNRKKKLCNKKNVGKDYIEDLVVAKAREQLTDENIDGIAREIEALCEKEKDSPNARRLMKLLTDNEKQKANLLEALKLGSASASAAKTVFEEIDRLDTAHTELEKEITLESVQHVDMTASEIKFFLTKLRNGDIDDVRYKKMLITVLVNAVYLYDDELTIIFNAAGKPVTVTASLLDEIQADHCSFMKSLAPPTPKYEKTLI